MGNCGARQKFGVAVSEPSRNLPILLAPQHLEDDLVSVPSFEFGQFDPVEIDWKLFQQLVPPVNVSHIGTLSKQTSLPQTSGSTSTASGRSLQHQAAHGALGKLKYGDMDTSDGPRVPGCMQDYGADESSRIAQVRDAIKFWSTFQPGAEAMENILKMPQGFSYSQGGIDSSGTNPPLDQNAEYNNTDDQVDAFNGTTGSRLQGLDYEVVLSPLEQALDNSRRYQCLLRTCMGESVLNLDPQALQTISNLIHAHWPNLDYGNATSLNVGNVDVQNYTTSMSRGYCACRESQKRHTVKRHGHSGKPQHTFQSLSSLSTISDYNQRDEGILENFCQQAALQLDELFCAEPHNGCSDAISNGRIVRNKFGDWSDVPLL
ncbi:hypothetical protein BdWA1_002117 [Babesia duncani]|uniref:Uncharacterized protein n=1 Tax=Babesia duncani TaxID=323732 RepID=A0AAD9UP98_9APIC|nr:hypothetical protein BdWA1_002117 [Babesia duncani]